MNLTITNRKVLHEYHILKEYEAGLILCGSEVKALRKKDANISEAYCYISKDEAFIKNMFIAKYLESSYMNHDERQTRKLLLHRKEIKDILKRTQETYLRLSNKFLDVMISIDFPEKFNYAHLKGKTAKQRIFLVPRILIC
jgi:SsrA-binding protein